MPPKRTKKKLSIGETVSVTASEDSTDELSNYRIFRHPLLKMQRITERGCAATVADIQANLSNASDWLHAQKAALKEIVRKANGNKRIPKTPRRGITFAKFRESVQSYSQSVLSFEDELFAEGVACPDEEHHTNSKIADTRDVNLEDIQDSHEGPSLQDSEQYISAAESVSDSHIPERVKIECSTLPVTDLPVIHDRLNSAKTPVAVVRSTLNAKAGPNATSVTSTGQQISDDLSSSSSGNAHTSATPYNLRQVRAAAGKSQTHVHRILHQHVVTTPCKREYRNAVQRVMDDQIMARNLSPKRAPTATPASEMKGARAAVTLMNTKLAMVKNKAKVARLEKETLAAQLREEQCKERAERIRREREEKAMRAQRRREQKEFDEKLKAEALRQKEEREERRREELRLQRSPARSKCPSRVVSPARVQRTAMNNDGHTAAKMLLPSSPCRAPSKMARVIGAEGEPAREHTRNMPTREIRRKTAREHVVSDDSMDDDFVQRVRAMRHHELVIEERERIMREQHERQERLREEETRRMKREEDERQHSMTHEISYIKMEVDEEHSATELDARVGENDEWPCNGEQKISEARQEKELRHLQSCIDEHHVVASVLLNAEAKEEKQPCPLEDPEERRREKLKSLENTMKEKCNQVQAAEGELKLRDKDVEHRRSQTEEQQKLLLFEEKKAGRVRAEEEERSPLCEQTERNFQAEKEQKQEHSEEERQIREQVDDGYPDQLRSEEEQHERLQQEENRHYSLRAQEERKEQLRLEEEEARSRLHITSNAELQNRHLLNVSVNMTDNSNQSKNSSYDLTPDKVLKPPSENNYNIEDLSSGDETDQEDAPRKKVPLWAEGNRLRRAVEEQSQLLRTKRFDPDIYFGGLTAPDLTIIFGNSKKYPRRGSSGVWDSPLSRPRLGIGEYQRRCNQID